jgi:hypothetical protein
MHHENRMRLRAIRGAWLLGLLLAPGGALAQYNPDASANLGARYGSMTLGQSILGGTRDIGRKPSAGRQGLSPQMQDYCRRWPNEGVCRANAPHPAPAVDTSRRDELMRQIAPEYERRVRLYGKASADEWLAATAREMGRQDGVRARRMQHPTR